MSIYPKEFGTNPNFPKKEDFEIIEGEGGVGRGVITKKHFSTGELIAETTGEVVPEIKQHTLQISSEEHLYDPWFSGYFLHSCDPNVELDMQERKVIALKPIMEGEYLTMDYASTEDTLYKDFTCECGADNCRGWITGKLDELPF